MSSRTSAGSTFKVSSAKPTAFTVAGYAALTWTEVGEVTDFGEFGRVYNLVTHNPVANRSTVKKKGSFNEGEITLQMALDTDDAGQIIMKAATVSDANFYFELSTQNGDKYYFPAVVMSFKVSVGTVDKITSASTMLQLTSEVGGVGIVESLAAV
jgi:hypothetical protein